MCVIWGSALGERLGATLDATAGLLEVIVVDANRELIVVTAVSIAEEVRKHAPAKNEAGSK